jgi:hypothetical protein
MHTSLDDFFPQIDDGITTINDVIYQGLYLFGPVQKRQQA